MSFQDEIAKVVEAALAEKEQERQEAAAFDAKWSQLRQDLILPLLAAAGRGVQKVGQSHAGFKNGSVRLTLSYGGAEPYLDFSPDQKKEVICKSSLPGDPEERFSLENLTEEVVRDKVAKFVFQVVRDKKREGGSVYEERGLRVF